MNFHTGVSPLLSSRTATMARAMASSVYRMLAVLLLARAAQGSPLPFPLPANFSFGICGDLPPGVSVAGCSAPVALAAKISVRCSTGAGCDTGCAKSALAQGVFARYEARLSGGGAPPAPPVALASAVAPPRPATTAVGGRFWWRLNNTNCNLHDLAGAGCSTAGGPAACKATCEAHPDCGGFLLYTHTGGMALKNSSCWADVGPLPAADAGDDLFVMRDIPEPPPLPASGELSTVEVCLEGPSEVLGPETDESYSLSVSAAASAATVVRAKTIFGAMHGLESLTQLVDVRVGAGVQTTIPFAPVEIHDEPRFSFRGLMIDSGRHFLPISHVKKTVVAASMAKLNLIHWHLVDSQSFASCSEQFPSLCAEGAYPNKYSASNADGSKSRNVSKATYSPAELRDLVAFAKSHGVRIQPEWDMPGHGSWGYGMPELMACKDALDPTRPELYTFLRTFLTEMAGIFEERYLFLGGDELSTTCFDDNPRVAAWMKAKGLNASSTQQYFWQQMSAKVFPFLNKTISVWRADDPLKGALASNLPPGSVLNVYQSLKTAWAHTLPAGTSTVVSMAGDRWYLDSEAAGYNQNSWKASYNFNAQPGLTRGGSWVSASGGSCSQ